MVCSAQTLFFSSTIPILCLGIRNSIDWQKRCEVSMSSARFSRVAAIPSSSSSVFQSSNFWPSSAKFLPRTLTLFGWLPRLASYFLDLFPSFRSYVLQKKDCARQIYDLLSVTCKFLDPKLLLHLYNRLKEMKSNEHTEMVDTFSAFSVADCRISK